MQTGGETRRSRTTQHGDAAGNSCVRSAVWPAQPCTVIELFRILTFASAFSAIRVTSRNVSFRTPRFGVSTGHAPPSPSKISANERSIVPELTTTQPGLRDKGRLL